MARGLDVVGDRWVLLILRDAFLGRTRFEEFRKSTGASRTTLTWLKMLCINVITR